MKNGRKWVALLLCAMVCVAGTLTTAAAAEPYKIGILQYVEHPALDAAVEGFLAALKDQGIETQVNLLNASADQGTLQLMADQLVQDQPHLLLGVATPSVQALSGATQELPILGTAVTDYVGAELIESNEAPNINVSGTTDMNPIDQQIALLQKLVPEAKTIGICYTSSEINSQIQAELAKSEAEKRGLTVIVKTVSSVSEVQQALESLVGEVEAIYLPTDNVFASAVPIVANVTDAAKIPVIVGESNMCKGGLLATVGLNYYKLGYQTGMMATRVLLEGANPAEMPIEALADADMTINQDNASVLGYVFPQEIIQDAASIVWGGKVFVPEQ